MHRAILCAVVAALVTVGCGGGGGSGSGSGSTVPGAASASTDAGHGTTSCPSGNAIFSVPPVALSALTGWVPLGAMEPPGHTFPTDHQYLYVASSSSGSLPVLAPADMRIWMVYHTTGSQTQYTIFFQPCAQVIGRFGTIAALAPDLAAAAGAIDQNCQTGSPSPSSVEMQCQKELQFDVKAGQQIGTVSATGINSLDFYLWDSRVVANAFIDAAMFTSGPEPAFGEANIVPASDYFTPGLEAQIGPKVGSFDGTVHRTVPPLGGTIAADLAGTAAGYWFTPGQPYPPESYEAAFAPDPIQPDTTLVISLGVSQTNVSNGVLGTRMTVTGLTTSGLVNRTFASVSADGNLYCYQGVVENTNDQSRVILLQLTDATTLKVERLAASLGSCAAAQPWAFSSNAVSYKR